MVSDYDMDDDKAAVIQMYRRDRRGMFDSGGGAQEKSFIPKATTFEDAMAIAGHGLFNVYVQVTSCMIYMHASQQLYSIIYIEALIACEMHLNELERLLVESAVHLGILTCCWVWGILTDCYGRRYFMCVCTLGTVITTIGSSFCNSFITFFCARFIAGCLISGSFSNVLIYVSEVHMRQRRDVAIARVVASAGFIKVLVPILAWIILPHKDYVYTSWRVYLWFFEALGVLGAFMLCFVPPSPRYVREEFGPFRALPIVAQIYYRNNLSKNATFPVKALRASLTNVRVCEHGIGKTFRQIKQMFCAPLLTCAIVIFYCMFMVFFLYHTIHVWIPIIYTVVAEDTEAYINLCEILTFQSQRSDSWIKGYRSSELEHSNCTVNDLNLFIYPYMVAVEALLFIPYLSINGLVLIHSKRLLYTIMMSIASGALFIASMMPQALTAAVLASCAMISGCCVIMLVGMVNDAFPTAIRATAMSFMYMMGSLGTVSGAVLFEYSEHAICNYVFKGVAILGLGTVVVMYRYWPDTKEVRGIMEKRGFTY